MVLNECVHTFYFPCIFLKNSDFLSYFELLKYVYPSIHVSFKICSSLYLDTGNEYRVLDPDAVKKESADDTALYAVPHKDRKRQVQFQLLAYDMRLLRKNTF